jgi:hypothetical protein
MKSTKKNLVAAFAGAECGVICAFVGVLFVLVTQPAAAFGMNLCARPYMLRACNAVGGRVWSEFLCLSVSASCL